MLKLLFLSLVVCSMVSSCTKGKCGKAHFQLTTIGFSEEETDTIIIRRFEKNTNFSILYDSLFLHKTNTSFSFYSDTTYVYYNSHDGSGIPVDDFDYQISLPQPISFFKLTDITYIHEYIGSGEKIVCYPRLSTYQLDGQMKKDSEGLSRVVVKK